MTPQPTTTPTETPNQAPRKSPADFQQEADRHNQRVAENAAARAQVQSTADALNAEREVMIENASLYGVTAKYGRAAIMKA